MALVNSPKCDGILSDNLRAISFGSIEQRNKFARCFRSSVRLLV